MQSKIVLFPPPHLSATALQRMPPRFGRMAQMISRYVILLVGAAVSFIFFSASCPVCTPVSAVAAGQHAGPQHVEGRTGNCIHCSVWELQYDVTEM